LPLSLLLGAPLRAEAAPSRVGLRAIELSDDAAFAAAGGGKERRRLTLDPKLQRAAERLLAQTGAHEAAIVASDVRTGRVLVWASRGNQDYVATPFAPSASLFKIVTAAALLDGGRVSTGTSECYTGGFHAIKPEDLEGRGAACSTVGEALGKSINLVFARLAKKHLTPDDLRRTARELGFDGEVPIDIPAGSSAVQVPDDPFGMAKAAAGFWNGRLTALGALFAMQTIANDGERVRLSILDQGAPTPRVSAGRALDLHVARDLRRMLEVTVRRGTSAKAFRYADGRRALPTIGVAAKTGTLVGTQPARMYSWFAAFAPAAKPEIAVAVVLGNDIRWRTKANIVGRDLLEAYFHPAGADGARAQTSRSGQTRAR
jgi:cell division protein FtsI/penicillin-binding protein 2